jgi:hypothetical protein
MSADAASWRRDLGVAVNLSPRRFATNRLKLSPMQFATNRLKPSPRSRAE